MRTYVIRRLLLLPVTVLLLSVFSFGLVRLVPGSVVDARLSNTMGASASADPEQRAALEAHFGLDKPVHVQYVNWIGQVLTGDFGDSWLTRESIMDTFARRMPVTAQLLFLTLLLYIPIGIGTGIWSAVRRNRPDDYGIRFVTVLFLAIPNFWLATLVVLIPLVLWRYALPAPYEQLWVSPDTNLIQMIVPAAVAALSGAAVLGRLARSEMLEVLRQDYV
ncbi:MAG: ABC transporter permease, partial [Dehalococcoidia bacterium]|nr:ABC transporter permease [Dehalococcoidia bacterium]